MAPSDDIRLDQEITRRGLARSRSQAAELIKTGHVQVQGKVTRRPGIKVSHDAQISVDTDPWVSRAAHKLIGALDDSGIQVPTRVLDAGASTGGFTQVLLDRGAETVYAVDVGHDQLAPILRDDPRVINREGLNLRDLEIADLDLQPVDLVVGDVSFISLRLIMEPIFHVISPAGCALLLVKPQFEVGRARLGAGGVVHDPADRQWAVEQVVDTARQLGWECIWRGESQLPGPAGNIEIFVAFRRMGSAASS